MSAEATRVAAPATTIDTAALRRAEFPWADETVYLNHASIGPLPERTRLALEAFNRRRAMPFHLPDRDLMGTLTESRRHLAGLIGATPEEIALTVNTSFGLGVVARALPLRPGDAERGGDDDLRPHVRQQVSQQDPPVQGTQRLGGEHELGAAENQDLTPNQPRHSSPAHDPDHHEHHRERRLDGCGDSDQQEQRGKSESDVGQPHHQCIDPTTVISGQQAEKDAQGHGNRL